ncbi:MAG: hypothetical protein IPG97_06735 [Microthrixaceae bacterium]|nr:hypothetical protein [Microthrixaceae bacterium]
MRTDQEVRVRDEAAYPAQPMCRSSRLVEKLHSLVGQRDPAWGLGGEEGSIALRRLADPTPLG